MHRLIDFAGDVKGKTVLDLAGGSGRLCREVNSRGAIRATLIDECYDMLPTGDQATGIEIERWDVQSWLKSEPLFYDFIFCQQAINYWFDETMASYISDWLVDGGVFAFNTFEKDISNGFHKKEYRLNDLDYMEISWKDQYFSRQSRMIHHVQMCTGLAPHYTSFNYIHTHEFRDWLEPYFAVEIEGHANTVLYKCTKR